MMKTACSAFKMAKKKIVLNVKCVRLELEATVQSEEPWGCSDNPAHLLAELLLW